MASYCCRRKSIRRKEMPCRLASSVGPHCCQHYNLTRTNFHMVDLGQESLEAARVRVMASYCCRRKSIRRKEMPCRLASSVGPHCCPNYNLTRTSFRMGDLGQVSLEAARV